jgi:predicted RNA binding protein YcfA (HicA-like mRNA interferase family)
MPKLHSSKHIINILESRHFIFVSQRGSHKKFIKGKRIVIVPDLKKEIPMGTFFSILRQSGLKKKDFD